MSEDKTLEVVESKPEGQPKEVQVQKQKPIAIQGGTALPQTVEEQYRLAAMYFKSGILPNRFKTVEQVLTAMHFVSEHFPKTPLTAIRQVAVVNGTPVLFGDLPLAKVQASSVYAGKQEFFETKEGTEPKIDEEIYRAVCITGRRLPSGRIDEHKTSFSIDEAKIAGLLGSPTWTKYKKDMLKYRARSRNLKDQFADLLNGVGIAEYDFGVHPVEVESGSVETLAEKMNRLYGKEEKNPEQETSSRSEVKAVPDMREAE